MLQESPKECHEATVPTKVPGDVKAECGDLEVVYVKSVDCPSGIADFRLFHFPIFCLWPDQGHCAPDKGHCIPDKGHCRYATWALNYIPTILLLIVMVSITKCFHFI